MHHRIVAVFALFWLLSICGQPLAAQSQPPNLLVIVADDLGPETLGCYGMTRAAIATPAIDSIAATGVRFTRAYANPQCSPSRACLQTGRYAFRTGVQQTLGPGSRTLPADPGLRDEETLLPEALPSTYANAMFGKWHLGYRHGNDTPNIQGWQHFAGGMDLGLYTYSLWIKVVDGQWSVCTNYATTENVDDALAWIGQQTQPWALMLCFNAPHWPYDPPPQHLHSFQLNGRNVFQTPLPFYQALVQAMDTEIGRLLNGLGADRANTNIVLTSDNGSPGYLLQQLAPQSHGKGTLYEGGVRVPLLISGPSVINPGRTCGELIHLVDLFPTCLDLCGANQQGGIDGVSALPLLEDRIAPIRTSIYNEQEGSCSVTHQDFKLIRFYGGFRRPPHDELYDLGADPMEINDLLRVPTARMRSIHQSLSNEMRQLQNQGWASTYGEECVGSFGAASLTVDSPPRLGSTYTISIDYDSPTAGLTMATLGSTDQMIQGTPLPFDLSQFGMPGCMLHHDSVSIAYVGPPDGTFSITIPQTNNLLWVSFFAQAFALDPTANAAGLISSSGLRCVIGR
jgi:arylsulfatase A-like enzyme